MAGRKLTEEERVNFAARNAASKASSAADKAKAAGVNKATVKTRTPAEIDAAIAKAKADPKFQAREAKLKAAMEATGTQSDHHITGMKNFSKAVGEGLSSGGILGVAIHATAAYNQELKRQAKEKSDLAKKVY